MKLHQKIISLVLAATMSLGAMFCASAANRDIAELSAKTGLEVLGNPAPLAELPATVEELPASYSSADLGFTLAVRQQHDNTCWAFGTLSTFETLLLKSGEKIETFAPQHTNYWGTKREDGTGWQRNSHQGGYSYIPLGYLTSWAGPINESVFPETSSTQEDYELINTLVSPEYGLTEAIYFNSDADLDSIKNLIYTYGAVVCSYNSDLSYLTDNTSFYCADATLTTSQLQGHCVSVVGWDDNYSKENFADSKSGTPECDGAWLMKNSWGSYSNRLGGYFWISYEDAWVFDEIFGPSYALTDYAKINSGTKIYQNEVDGATYEFNYLTSTSNPYANITYMNAFDFTEEDRTLDKVVFESTSLGADYSVYYIPFDAKAPTAETRLWTKLYSGTIDHCGYICADFEDVEVPAGKGAIGIRINNESTYLENSETPGYTYIPNSIGVGEWLTTSSKQIFLPQSDYGMSYYMIKGDRKVTDVMAFYKKYLADEIGGTFVIKAITQNTINEPDPSEPITATEATEPTTAVTNPTETSTAPVTTVTTPVTTATIPATTVTIPVTSTVPATTVTIPATTQQETAPSSSTVTTTSTNPFNPVDPFVYKLGDADLNDKVNVKDATLIQKHAASLITLSEREFMAADSNGNGNVNVVDATIIQKFVAGLDTGYDIGKTNFHFE